MGNQLAQPQRLQPDHLLDLPNVVFKDSLGGGRFLKTALCVHDDGGLVVVKVYYKRDDSPNLQKHEEQLLAIRNRLSAQHTAAESHVWPFQRLVQTDKAVYMLRQHIFSNLHDRLSTRPFLSDMEKRWMVFQLLHAVAHSHAQGVCHGDIKLENCLVSSWNWLFLTDFAPYKPTYLPADNPANFSFFFDTGGRRRCYVAPERFFEDSAKGELDPDQPLEQSMDIFSLGCCIAEMFSEGKALFDLSQLLAYRSGDFSPTAALSGIDEDIQEMVMHMTQRSPGNRMSAGAYLATWGPRVFPAYFQEPLHAFFHGLLPLNCDSRVRAVSSAFQDMRSSMLAISRTQAEHRARAAARQLASGPPDQRQSAGSGRDVQPGEEQEPAEMDGGGSRAPQVDNQGGAHWREAGADLLARVGALLSDTEVLEGRLAAEGHELSAETGAEGLVCSQDSDGLALSPTGKGGSRSVEAVSSTESPFITDDMSVGSEVGEVATEEFYEHQFRESGGEFHSAVPAENQLGPRCKEDLSLPAGGGWHWAGDWVVAHGVHCDGSGWVYRAGGVTAVSGPGDGAGRGWTASVTADCLWRRRCWRRKRRRSAPGAAQPPVLPGELAAASVPDAPALGVDTAPRCQGMVLLAALLCSLLRGARLQECRLVCLQLLGQASSLCDDDTRLQRVVPYLVAMVGDTSAMVRAAAVDALASILATVEHLPPSDAKIFTEYIFPGLSMLPSDPEEIVRIAYASNLSKLASVAAAFLTRTHNLQQIGGQALGPSPSGGPSPLLSHVAGQDPETSHQAYDMDVLSLREAVERVILELLTGGKSTATTKRALMPHVCELSAFLARRRANDFFLPLLITCLNAKNWLLTAALFQHIAAVGPITGRHSLDIFLMPCLEQALKSDEEGVVWQALGCLTRVVCCHQLQRRAVIKAAFQVIPQLRSPAASVRTAAAGFVVAAYQALSAADSYALLMPAVEEAVGQTPVSLDSIDAIVSALPPPQHSPGHSTHGAEAAVHLAEPPAVSAGPVGGLGTAPLGMGPRPGSTSGAGGRRRTGARRTYLSPVIDASGLPVYIVRAHPALHPLGGSMLDCVLATVEAAEAISEATETSTSLAPDKTKEKLAKQTSPRRPSKGSGVVDLYLGKKAGGATVQETPCTERILAWASRLAPAPSSDLSASRLAPSTLVAATARLEDQGAAGSRDLPGSRTASGTFQMGTPTGGMLGDFSPGSARETWRPRGVLVAHLSEHRRAINQLAVAPSQAYFVSASNDETVKVWDCRRLEKDVSFRSRLTYANQGGKILSVAFCEDGTSVASASSSGSLHIWRVEYSSRAQGVPDRYTGILTRRQLSTSEGSLLEVASMGSLLLYSTQRGGIHALDMRCDREAWTLPLNPWAGLLERMVADPEGHNWLLTGSSRGQLDLWDLRFRICVQTWSHPLQQPVEALALAPRPRASLGRGCQSPASGAPLVYIAAGGDELGLWDLEQGKCLQVLKVVGAEETDPAAAEFPAALGDPQSAAPLPGNSSPPRAAPRSLRTEELGVPPPRASGCRAVLPTTGGPVITGGSDKCLRLWDAKMPEQSYVIAGPREQAVVYGPPNPSKLTKRKYIWRQFDDVGAILEVKARGAGQARADAETQAATGPVDLNNQQSNACHQDSIMHIAEAKVSDRLLLSCSRDGTIKAWK